MKPFHLKPNDMKESKSGAFGWVLHHFMVGFIESEGFIESVQTHKIT